MAITPKSKVRLNGKLLINTDLDDFSVFPYICMQDLVYETTKVAKEHGWWRPRASDRIKAIPERLALIHSEVSEALEEYRNGHKPTEIYYSEEGKPEGLPVELADIMIRVANLCGELGIDLGEAMRIKHRYNKTRPWKHGNKRI